MMKDNAKEIENLASQLIKLAFDTIIVNMRFLDTALGKLTPQSRAGLGGTACDGRIFYYDPLFLIRKYTEDPCYVNRCVLHVLLHLIFSHGFGAGQLDAPLWDLSCDIAVENMIIELDQPSFALSTDENLNLKMKGLKKGVTGMSADRIYKYFLANPPSSMAGFSAVFKKDEHLYWRKSENYEISQKDWEKITERIKAELKTFSKSSAHAESLLKSLESIKKKREDYSALLARFCVMGEELMVSEDEFDYIYYTYGLTRYDNMPLIEPLEFSDVKKIRDFAIVLDTSASCQGSVIRDFLIKTYSILSNSASFFQRINVHIIQCDNQVQSDTVIRSQGDFDAFLTTGKLTGYGGTDFRPAFEYVDRLIEERCFTDFRGLIYFTDGFGIYPDKKPEYDCIFAFSTEEDLPVRPPWWAIPVTV